MATQGRRNGIDLIARMKTEPYRFRFFQAIRVLKLAEMSAGRKAALPRGLRFRTPLSLAFLPSEVLRFERRPSRSEPGNGSPEPRDEDGPPHEMEVGFLGLTGPSGVLPHHYTTLLMDRKQVQRDSSAHAFFDVFNHRVISLFYEAWEKYRFHVAYELGAREGFTQHLLDLLGTGRPGPCSRDGGDHGKSVPIQALAYFSGALGRRPLPSSSLIPFLGAYFGVKVALEQFVGQWIEAPVAEQTSLGGESGALGLTTVLGQRMWDQQTKIRLRIGPLDQAAFREFQPGRSASSAFRQLLELCCGQALSCDVVLVLRKETVPPCVMDSRSPVPMSLGISTWIRTTAPDQDLADAKFRLL